MIGTTITHPYFNGATVVGESIAISNNTSLGVPCLIIDYKGTQVRITKDSIGKAPKAVGYAPTRRPGASGTVEAMKVPDKDKRGRKVIGRNEHGTALYACRDCGKETYGLRCRTCAKKYGFRENRPKNRPEGNVEAYSVVAAKYGVSRQAVAEQVKRRGWAEAIKFYQGRENGK